MRSLLCVSCLLNNMKNKADHFFTRQTRKDESGDICNCIYIYMYIFIYVRAKELRATRAKDQKKRTHNNEPERHFVFLLAHTHTHSHAAGHPVVYMCEKSLPQ